MCCKPVHGDAAFDEDPVHLGHDVACGPLGQRDAQPFRFDRDVDGAELRRVEQAAGLFRFRALDLELEGRARQQLGNGALADHLAPIHDGDRIARALDLVQEVRGQHDRSSLGDERLDHVAHVEHAAGVEAVHGLVEDEELGVTEQAGRDTQTLAHAHGVLRHLVVGPVQDADTLERRGDAGLGRRLTCRGEDLQVLPAGQVSVEAGFVDDGPHPGQRLVAMARDGMAEERHRAGVGVGQTEEDPDQGRLPGPIGPEIPEGAASRDQEFHAIDGDVLPEPLREPVRLDRPRAGATGGTRYRGLIQRDGGHAVSLYRVCPYIPSMHNAARQCQPANPRAWLVLAPPIRSDGPSRRDREDSSRKPALLRGNGGQPRVPLWLRQARRRPPRIP